MGSSHPSLHTAHSTPLPSHRSLHVGWRLGVGALPVQSKRAVGHHTVRPRTPPQSLLTCSLPPHYPMHAQVEMSTVLLWRVDLPHTRGAQACALRARASNAPSRASARLRKPRPSVCSCLGPIMPCRPGPIIQPTPSHQHSSPAQVRFATTTAGTCGVAGGCRSGSGATVGPHFGRCMLIIAWHGAVPRMPCSRCDFSVMRACTLAEVCAMGRAQLFSVQSCVLFVWSGPVPTDQNSI
jgi:hypothetical protein